jgi:predicted nucleic acid-binding protein
LAGISRVPVVIDINVLVDAVVAEPDPSRWESPPPIRGEASAMTLAILNEGLEFEMWLSGHLIDGALRVLSAAFSWTEGEAEQYRSFLESVVSRAGGRVEPAVHVTDCTDWEDNRVLELAETVGAFLIISSDDHLLRTSPWRGIPIQTPEAFVSRVDAMRRQARRLRR